MAHFAELDENNTVLQVIVVHNNELLDGEIESEAKGVEFCSTLFGHTSDVFVAPQPYPSWSLDDNFDWQAPTPMPEDDNLYNWNEETQNWDLVELNNDDTE